MPLIVRPARQSDAEALPAIERDAGRAFLAIPELAWISSDRVMPAEAHLPAIAAGAVWVAEDSDAGLVGFLSAERFAETLHIWEMAVKVDAQRRGVGAQLIAAAIDYAARHGVNAITLTTFRDVAWNAPFYARHSFRILAADELDERLRDVLREEVEAGLPSAGRCAMRRALPKPPG